MTMKLTFLGSGTSQGVPMIGCSCYVCLSTNPKNKRWRASVLLTMEDHKNILIDCSTDFRTQALNFNIKSIDSVLITHAHADHIFGLDDLRAYNHWQQNPIDLYMSAMTFKEVKRIYTYAFDEPLQMGGGVPQLDVHVIDGPFVAAGVEFTPIPIFHGKLGILGFRWGDTAYLTDCKTIPADSLTKLRGLKVLVLNALWLSRPHSTHLSIMDALDVIAELQPKVTYFTHIAHRVDHDVIEAILPPNVHLAYDGLVLTL